MKAELGSCPQKKGWRFFGVKAVSFDLLLFMLSLYQGLVPNRIMVEARVCFSDGGKRISDWNLFHTFPRNICMM